MILRLVLILCVAGFLTACSKKQETGNVYCDRMPEDSYCTGQKNPTIFDSL